MSSENSHINTILLISITIAGGESKELIISQSGNANNLASTVNLGNTFPDTFGSLVLGFLNS